MQTNSLVLSLNPFQGELGFQNAKHLLNRALFGAKYADIAFLKTYTAEAAFDFLMRNIDLPQPPIGVQDTDEVVPVGETWTTYPYTGKDRGERLYSYKGWWIEQMLHQELSLVEKMVLFWHNHFVIDYDNVVNTNYNYQYNNLLRENALANFMVLAERITINPGMLVYLNGEDNVKGAANENFARELFELFTIGKGDLIEPGNYTNYTEDDIREAAKVLTGWELKNQQVLIDPTKHDTGVKRFSSIFNGHEITNNNQDEYKDLIAMIFNKKETARYLVRKLYRWFVYYEITPDIEGHIIEPLADIFYDEGYEIKPVLKKLLSSEHFFCEHNRGCMIKNPAEYNLGIIRQLQLKTPKSDTIEEIQGCYSYFNRIHYYIDKQDMKVGNPPEVAGWPAYYLEPQFNQLWVNTVTIPQRASVAWTVVKSRIKTSLMPQEVKIDPFQMAYLANDPSDINSLLKAITDLLLPLPPSNDQIEEFKEILIPGLPDFEWTLEWNRFVDNPNDEDQKNAVAKQLTDLLLKITRMAEYQLI